MYNTSRCTDYARPAGVLVAIVTGRSNCSARSVTIATGHCVGAVTVHFGSLELDSDQSDTMVRFGLP